MTNTFNENQHDRARNGRFTAMHHAETQGVSLPTPSPNVAEPLIETDMRRTPAGHYTGKPLHIEVARDVRFMGDHYETRWEESIKVDVAKLLSSNPDLRDTFAWMMKDDCGSLSSEEGDQLVHSSGALDQFGDVSDGFSAKLAGMEAHDAMEWLDDNRPGPVADARPADIQAPPMTLRRAPEPNSVVTGQLSAYEMGLRTDDSGVTRFRLAVDLESVSERRPNDIADGHLPDDVFANGTELTPVGVVDGKIIVEASIEDADSNGMEMDDPEGYEAEWERGQADRQAWLDKTDFTPPAAELDEFLPASEIGDLHPVPAFPEGTPEGAYISSGEKDGVQRIALCAPDDGVVASFRFAPGEFENYEEFNIEGEGEFDRPVPVPEWVDGNREEFREMLESVARNRVRLYERAEMRTRWIGGLDQRVEQMAVAGNPDGDEF